MKTDNTTTLDLYKKLVDLGVIDDDKPQVFTRFSLVKMFNETQNTAEILRRKCDDKNYRDDLRAEYPERRIRKSSSRHFEE